MLASPFQVNFVLTTCALFVRARGFGFVQFKSKADATKALQAMNQAEIGGRTVNVNFAKARESRPPRSFNGPK